MSYKIVNLTLPVVVKEIENVLEDYPEYPYRITFSIQEFKQKLIAYVLSNICNHYTVIDDSQEQLKEVQLIHLSSTEQLHMENMIRDGILCILRENAESVGFIITPEDSSLN